ncbi:MAG: NUDIX domain-containing protein [Actinomycetota bacterium]
MGAAGPVRRRAGVIAVREGSVALIERHRGGRQYWVVPGGGIEPGETIPEAAAREGREELGVPVTVGALLVELSAPYLNGTPGHHYYFEATVASTEIRIDGPELDNPQSSGTYRAVWVRLEDVPSLDVRPPEIAELIARYGEGDWPERLVVRATEAF